LYSFGDVSRETFWVVLGVRWHVIRFFSFYNPGFLAGFGLENRVFGRLHVKHISLF